MIRTSAKYFVFFCLLLKGSMQIANPESKPRSTDLDLQDVSDSKVSNEKHSNPYITLINEKSKKRSVPDFRHHSNVSPYVNYNLDPNSNYGGTNNELHINEPSGINKYDGTKYNTYPHHPHGRSPALSIEPLNFPHYDKYKYYQTLRRYLTTLPDQLLWSRIPSQQTLNTEPGKKIRKNDYNTCLCNKIFNKQTIISDNNLKALDLIKRRPSNGLKKDNLHPKQLTQEISLTPNTNDTLNLNTKLNIYNGKRKRQYVYDKNFQQDQMESEDSTQTNKYIVNKVNVSVHENFTDSANDTNEIITTNLENNFNRSGPGNTFNVKYSQLNTNLNETVVKDPNFTNIVLDDGDFSPSESIERAIFDDKQEFQVDRLIQTLQGDANLDPINESLSKLETNLTGDKLHDSKSVLRTLPSNSSPRLSNILIFSNKLNRFENNEVTRTGALQDKTVQIEQFVRHISNKSTNESLETKGSDGKYKILFNKVITSLSDLINQIRRGVNALDNLPTSNSTATNDTDTAE